MPYIKEIDRDKYTAVFYQLREAGKITHPGDLNYLFTIIMKHYLIDNGENYQAINDCIGALEGAKLEFYRRVAIPYEENAITRNGDIK